MWAYYANNSKGFCVEYDVLKGDAIHEVSYEPSRIKLGGFLLELISNSEAAMQGDKEAHRVSMGQMHLLMQSIYMKDSSWKHEKEYRIAYLIGKNNETEGNVPIRQLGLKTSMIIAGLQCEKECRKRLNDISLSIGIGPVRCAGLYDEGFGIALNEFEQ